MDPVDPGREAQPDAAPTRQVDVVVIGAGFSGMYALYRLQSSKLKVAAFETGDGVGGTWYWNRYPGARVDIESMQYSYSFDEELQQDWHWPEYFSPQADLEAYANHVADRFGLREMIQFSTTVTGMRFDENLNMWHVRTSRGDHVLARWVIAATGSLDKANTPPWPGFDEFRGEIYHTSRWPRHGVDFAGARVGLIGTGSTGIQVAPLLAEQADHLTVFQRTPNFTLPSRNRALDLEYEREFKENYADRRRQMLTGPSLSLYPRPERSVFEYSAEERERILEEAWNSQNGFRFLHCFNDTSTDLAANDIVAEFVRSKIRQIVRDPDVAEMLCPKTYPIGAKRICMDTGYYETFNRSNVSLVDVSNTPITRLTTTGVETAAASYSLDAIVLATGFDAMTGSMLAMNIEGVNGMALREKWANGPTNYLGIFVAGFPNLFMVHGPGSPSVRAQMITSGEWQINWILDVIQRVESSGHTRLETSVEWERKWGQELQEAVDKTLFGKADSWYSGANIEGKPRMFMIYVGGFDAYRRHCTEALENDLAGLDLSGRDMGKSA